MTLTGAWEKLRSLGLPVFRTAEAAAILETAPANASTLLARLGKHRLVVRIKRGLWALPGTDLLAIAPHLTAPLPSYISLQSALYTHGMISQIPEVAFCVSLARTRRYTSPLGTVSVHHLPGALFFGFESSRDGSFQIATPEKALLDFLYLGPAKTRLFAALPELSIPAGFSRKRLASMIDRIPGQNRRAYVQTQAGRLLENSF